MCSHTRYRSHCHCTTAFKATSSVQPREGLDIGVGNSPIWSNIQEYQVNYKKTKTLQKNQTKNPKSNKNTHQQNKKNIKPSTHTPKKPLNNRKQTAHTHTRKTPKAKTRNSGLKNQCSLNANPYKTSGKGQISPHQS